MSRAPVSFLSTPFAADCRSRSRVGGSNLRRMQMEEIQQTFTRLDKLTGYQAYPSPPSRTPPPFYPEYTEGRIVDEVARRGSGRRKWKEQLRARADTVNDVIYHPAPSFITLHTRDKQLFSRRCACGARLEPKRRATVLSGTFTGQRTLK